MDGVQFIILDRWQMKLLIEVNIVQAANGIKPQEPLYILLIVFKWFHNNSPYKVVGVLEIQVESYLTFFPKADEIVRNLWDDVAVVVSDGAAAQFWLGVQDLLAQLLQLSVVTVEQQVASQLLGAIHGAETTLCPEAVSLPWTTTQTISAQHGSSLLYRDNLSWTHLRHPPLPQWDELQHAYRSFPSGWTTLHKKPTHTPPSVVSSVSVYLEASMYLGRAG